MRDYKKRKRALRYRRLLIFLAVLSCFIIVAEMLYLVQRLQAPQFLSPVPLTNVYKKVLAAMNISSQTNELVDLLKKNNFSVISLLSYEKDAFLLKLETGEEAVLSSKKSLAVQVSSLHLILSRLTIEGKRVRRVDLRFNNPVIVFAASQ